MSKSLPEIFKEVSFSEYTELLTCGKLEQVLVNAEKRSVLMKFTFGSLIDRALLLKMTEAIKKTYKLNEVTARVVYQGVAADDAYYQSVKPILYTMLPASESLLGNSSASVEGGCMVIRAANGCELFNSDRYKSALSAMFEQELGVSLHVRFEANEEYDPEAFLKMQEEAEREAVRRIREEVAPKGDEQMIYGKEIPDDDEPISSLSEESGRVILKGRVFSTDSREIRGGRMLFKFDITDYTGSTTIKMVERTDVVQKVMEKVEKGMVVRLRGVAQYDKYDREVVVLLNDLMKIKDPWVKTDDAPEKRVELHVHSKMSAMDGVSEIKDLVKRAAKWGHKAIAVTDHGVVQAFPDAMDAGKKNGIKILYGVECYLVDEESASAVSAGAGHNFDDTFVVFDLETTGLIAARDEIIEIGAVKTRNGEVIERFSEFIKPSREIPEKITELTGITNQMVADAPSVEEVLPRFLEFCKDTVLVAHNAPFDTGFVRYAAHRLDLPFEFPVVDTLQLSRLLLKELKRHKLNLVAEHLGVSLENHHRACDDAEATAGIFFKLVEKLLEQGIESLEELENFCNNDGDVLKKEYFHAIILAKDMVGLKNLYQLISESHLKYFHKQPRVPKHLFLQHRDGLMIGSACEAGELYKALLHGASEEKIRSLAQFYDYYEIQPLGNNEFMVRNGMIDTEGLKNINRRIVALGEQYKKPVVATCDVHFLDPEDEVFRRIIMKGMGFSDADQQAPLYFRNTEEMLAEFAYLGEEKAYEVVVTNTNLIADMIEDIKPIPDGTFPPKIDGAEEEIEQKSIERAEKIYGSPLPELVKTRMDRELGSIIKNGFSVMYIIAERLVKKSLEDGYMVGSRGSVGSSFVAYLTGITEVNSLCPHYICPNCKHSEFITDGVYGSGFDLPDKTCPNCGTPYKKDGHDIPFETFLGFDGDKEPDIDLNFSGEYQAKAHKYTEVLFGEGNVYRAGTISTLADKTAYGYVKKYFEEKGQVVHNAEINRLVQGCAGIRKTTGQHPGGIMVVPRYKNIFDFCPIQKPANDMSADSITTHFDYHSISGRMLKLDILGHDDPTMIKMLEDLTGIDATTISLDDKETMSIFTSTEALGVTPEQIGSEVGTYAVPEFGTGFVRQMLCDTRPTTYSELVRISGLSHGTDVWLNNAQTLVNTGVAPLSKVICTRDDIMLYLIQCGVPDLPAFKIMEKVRKGKGLTPEDEALMRENNVPEWYIDSCNKIKYMFPKAHATAYVTMAFRIAWFKVHRALDFYTAYLTVRADAFDAGTMMGSSDDLRRQISAINAKEDATAKEKEKITVLEVCIEMYERGIRFLPIDLYESDAVKFRKVDGKILPPLSSLAGVGVSAAQNIVAAREEGAFFSKEDLRIRSKVSKTVIETLEAQGCLKGMHDSSQVTMFEF